MILLPRKNRWYKRNEGKDIEYITSPEIEAIKAQMEMDREILNMTVKPENARKVLDVLYDEPAVNRKKLVELTGITESTIKNYRSKNRKNLTYKKL